MWRLCDSRQEEIIQVSYQLRLQLCREFGMRLKSILFKAGLKNLLSRAPGENFILKGECQFISVPGIVPLNISVLHDVFSRTLGALH